MNLNLVGSMYGRPSIEIAHANVPQHGRKLPWTVCYEDFLFRPDALTNMATTGNSCF